MITKLLMIVPVLVVIAVIAVLLSSTEPTACTEDARQCPDGSFVVRDPANNCEFFPCPADFVVSAFPLNTRIGAKVTATWSVSSGESSDWIGLYSVGTGNRNPIKLVHTKGVASASTTFIMPAEGKYEFRYFRNNLTAVATSETITVAETGDLAITTITLPDGTEGKAYSTVIRASGGTPPYTWASLGKLPTGLELGTNGIISGTPIVSGLTSFRVIVSDGDSSEIASFSITIIDSQTLDISTTSLPNGIVSEYYTTTLQATGGSPPYTWASIGKLPTGLELATNGVISGTPTASGTTGFTVVVGDSLGEAISRSRSLTILESEDGVIFAPDNFVPLSAFLSVSSGEVVTFSVLPEILSYVSGETLLIACQSDGVVRYATPTTVGEAQGTVSHTPSQSGDCTIVVDTNEGVFENDFPIVTHWNGNLNGGRGGHEIGASDLIGDTRDTDPASPYAYNDQYALFSDDPNTRLPLFEQAVGEDFTVGQITNLDAVTDSDTVRKATGYPVVHKNYPWALDSSAAQDKQVQEGVPAFQIAHAYLIEANPGKASLASFILPPEWTSTPTKGYPVIFNGYYDLHKSSYLSHGVPFMTVMGNLLNSGDGPVLGVLWNSGGPSGTLGQLRSTYDNAALIFSTAESLLGADPNNVVMTGTSRGGTVALMMAANPYHTTYKVKYVIAYSPAVKFGDHALDYTDTNYVGVPGAMTGITGYKYSWQIGWEDPDTGLPARELWLQNLFNSPDKQTANDQTAWGQVSSLKSKGTKVFLSVSTHDYFLPFNLEAAYVERLRDAGVPVRFQINYRFGHSFISREIDEEVERSLRSLLNGEPVSLEEGTFHFRRQDDVNYQTGVQFYPTSQPIVSEVPIFATWGERVSFVHAGGPGDIINLTVYKIDDSEWNTNKNVVKGNEEPFFSQYVTLPTGDSIASAANWLTLPTDGSVASGFYIYDLWFSRNNGQTWVQVPPTSIPQPTAVKQPIFQILENEVATISGIQLMVLSEEGRSWGLSSEMID